jgi:hypothetical protein
VDADLILGPGPRPWTETWALFNHSYDEMRRFFTTPDRSAEQWKIHRVTNEFMSQCYAVKEHLNKDPAVPEPVRRAVEGYVNGSDGISLAIDVHNTAKHRQRRPGQRYARIGEILTGPRAFIHWEAADGSTVREDVLSVADKAATEWRDFLDTHNLTPPST